MRWRISGDEVVVPARRCGAEIGQPSGALDSPQDVARYPAAAPLGWVRGRVWPCGEDVLPAWEAIVRLGSGLGPPVDVDEIALA